MELQSLLPVLTSFGVVIIGGLLNFRFGRAQEAEKSLLLQKSQSYVDYFKAVSLHAHGGGTTENRSLLADAKIRVCIYGSPEVVDLLWRLEETGAKLGNRESQVALADLLAAVRSDTGKHDRASGNEALRRILFGPQNLDELGK